MPVPQAGDLGRNRSFDILPSDGCSARVLAQLHQDGQEGFDGHHEAEEGRGCERAQSGDVTAQEEREARAQGQESGRESRVSWIIKVHV